MVEVFGLIASLIWQVITIPIPVAEGISISIFAVMVTAVLMAMIVKYAFKKSKGES